MNFESPDDPDMGEQWQPGDGGSEDMPYGEHDPTNGILPDSVCDAYVPYEDSAPETPAFGVTRFEDTEPEFDGRPPEDYLEATYGVFDRLNREGYQEKHGGLFVDRERTVYIKNEHKTETGSTQEQEVVIIPDTPLEYVSPEGTVEIHQNPVEVRMRFKDYDGNTVSYCRYYVDRELDITGEYQVIRKDTIDHEAAAFADVEDLNHNDANILRIEAGDRHYRAIYDRKEQGNVQPMVSAEEAAWAFGEVLANARPITKTHDDVVAAIEGRIMTERIQEEQLEAGQAGTMARITGMEEYSGSSLFNKLFDAYRQRLLKPEEDATWDKRTENPFYSADGSVAVMHLTGVIPENPVTGPKTDYVTIVRLDRLDGSAMIQRMNEMGVPPPPYELDGTVTTRINLTQSAMPQPTGDLTTTFDVNGWGQVATVHKFVPTVGVMRVVRNYLWSDVEDAPSDPPAS